MLRTLLAASFVVGLVTSAPCFAQSLPPGPPAPGQTRAQPPGAD